jgi:hypothetical protein
MSESAQMHDTPTGVHERGQIEAASGIVQESGKPRAEEKTRDPKLGRPRRIGLRLARQALAAVFALIVLVVICMAGLAWRLAQGPLSLNAFAPKITEALQHRLAEGFVVSLVGAAIERRGAGPTLIVRGLSIKDASGREIISAPKAEVDFDPFRVLRQDVGLRRLALIEPQFKVSISRQGEISLVTAFSPPRSDGPPTPAPAPDPVPADAAGGLPPDHVRHGLVATYDDLFGPRGPFKVVNFVGIEDGRLVVDDERSDSQLVFSNLRASFARGERERVHLAMKGPSGDWSLDAEIERNGANEHRLIVEPKDAPAGDVLLPLVPRALALAPDMPVSGHIEIDIGGDGRVRSAEGSMTAGAAAWKQPGGLTSPLLVTDEISAAFSYDGSTHVVEINKFSVLAGETNIALKGRIVPAANGDFSFDFSGGDSAIAGAGPGDRPILLERIHAIGSLSPRDAMISVTPVELSGKDVTIAMNATYRRGRSGGMTVGIQSGRMPARALLALWPPMFVKSVRNYLVDRLDRGIIEHFSLTSILDDASIADVLADRPVPDESMKMSVDVSEMTLRFSDELPPLTSMVMHVDGTGRTSNIAVSSANIDLGDGHAFALSEGHFAVADTTKKPPVAQISFRAQGGADAFIAAMQRDMPRDQGQPVSPESVSGLGDARIQFTLALRDGVKAKDVPLSIQGSFAKLTAQNIGAGQRLENAQLTFGVLPGGVLTGKGDGRFAGAPAAIELRKDVGELTPQIRLAVTLDDAARAKLGLHAGKAITGPMPVKISPAAEAVGQAQAFDIEADLTRTAIDGIIPGWTKPAGRPAKLTFKLTPGDEQTRFSKINLLAAPVVVAGEAVTGKDGALISAKFDSFKVSPGDDLRVDVTRDGNVFKTAVRGNAIDLRPFVKSFIAGSQTDTQDADLDLKSANAIGFGDERGSSLDLHLSRRGQALTDFRFDGRIGRADVSAALSHEGRPLVTVETRDAGAFLRFIDLYRHMTAGEMVLRLTPSTGSQAGAISIRNFSLRNEEALGRIFAAAPPPHTANDSGGYVAPLDPGEVQFSRMQASFVRNAGRLDIREALIVGNQAGITVSGLLDFAKNSQSLSGTFVPAYGLNNVFSKVPFFGPLLGGGSNEGLLGVNFRVVGSLSQPEISVNPLSAMAPGILRKLFDIGGPGERDDEPNKQRALERNGTGR